jgi:hypothetical protein
MINVSVYTHHTYVRVRVTRLVTGARYPEQVLCLQLPAGHSQRGRDSLRTALSAVLDALDELAAHGEDEPTAR